MPEAIGSVLPFAVGVGISPIPIIAVILTLFSPRARVNGPAFLVGWVVGLAALVSVVFLAADGADVGDSADADDGVAWIKQALGVVLVVAAARKWRSQPASDDEAEMPGWMASIDRSTPARSLGLGFVLSLNPKAIALSIGAGASLAQVAPVGAEAVVGLAAYVLVGSLAVIAAVLYAQVGGERARRSLDEAKQWLTVHNGAVMAVLYLVFGTVLIGQGLGGS